MKTLKEVGEQLKSARIKKGMKSKQLVERTGLSAVTLRGLFEGKTDSRLTTLFAVADELGLELALLPKEFTNSLSTQPNTPAMESLVDRALRSGAERTAVHHAANAHYAPSIPGHGYWPSGPEHYPPARQPISPSNEGDAKPAPQAGPSKRTKK